MLILSSKINLIHSTLTIDTATSFSFNKTNIPKIVTNTLSKKIILKTLHETLLFVTKLKHSLNKIYKNKHLKGPSSLTIEINNKNLMLCFFNISFLNQ